MAVFRSCKKLLLAYDNEYALICAGALMDFKKETYSIQAAAYIRSLIRSGELSPGAPVREAFLSERLGISRAPIREALLSLAQEGLICAEPQKGKTVRHMSAREIYDSYTVAGILEGAGAVESVRLWTAQDADAFRAIVTSMGEQLNYATRLDDLAEIDEQFHAALLSACPNTRLVEMARSSCATISKYLYYQYWITLFTPREFYERHLVIAEAVNGGNAGHIEHILREHYRENDILMSELIHDEPAPQSPLREDAGRRKPHHGTDAA